MPEAQISITTLGEQSKEPIMLDKSKIVTGSVIEALYDHFDCWKVGDQFTIQGIKPDLYFWCNSVGADESDFFTHYLAENSGTLLSQFKQIA